MSLKVKRLDDGFMASILFFVAFSYCRHVNACICKSELSCNGGKRKREKLDCIEARR